MKSATLNLAFTCSTRVLGRSLFVNRGPLTGNVQHQCGTFRTLSTRGKSGSQSVVKASPTALRTGPKRKARPSTRNSSPSARTNHEMIDSRGEDAAKLPKYLALKSSKGALSTVSVARQTINWYPGHIAKAERALKETIKMVDVVIEVRDARIPLSTSHPLVMEWLGSRARVVVLNRADLVPEQARSLWKKHYDGNDAEQIRFVNAKQGRGIREVKRAAVEVGAEVNEKRRKKGLLGRPVRCLVMGFPNVGKSALINKLVGRNCVKSANKPGVTRNFQWIRISKDIELLDMPGIIPAKLITQEQAVRLAICDDIGHAAYDSQIIAAALIDELKNVTSAFPAFFNFELMAKRFQTHPVLEDLTGEDFLHEAAAKVAHGDLERTAVRLLTEFRSGTLGPVALEAPEVPDMADMADMRNTPLKAS